MNKGKQQVKEQKQDGQTQTTKLVKRSRFSSHHNAQNAVNQTLKIFM